LINNKKQFQIFLSCLFFLTVIKLFFFIDFEPRTDQAHQIGWMHKIINSEHFLGKDVFKNISSFFEDYKGFVFEVIKPAFFYGNLHANYFHLFPTLLISLISKILDISEINVFNFLSVFSTFLSFYFLIKIIQKIYSKEIEKNYLFFIFIFVNVVFFNWYSFLFSPLGIHNISSMVILFNFYFYNNYKKVNFFYYGILFSLSSLFHQINLIILSIFYLLIIVESQNRLKNLINFSIPVIISFLPLFIIIILNLDNYNNLYLNNSTENLNLLNKVFENFIFFIQKNLIFFPLLFIIFIFLLLNRSNNKFEKKIKIIFFLLLLFSIFTNEFFKASYQRVSIYLFYFYIFLFFKFLFTYIDKKNFKKIFSVIIIINLFYNIFLIYDNFYKISSKSEFYSYYNNQGNINKAFKELYQKNDFKNIVFLNNLSEDYYNIYNDDKKKSILKKPLHNIVTKNEFDYLKEKIFAKDIYIVSFVDNDVLLNKTVNILQNNSIFKCSSVKNVHLNKVFRNSDESFYKLIVDKLSC
tara:strand:+ start:2010 stop:3581 length:1572 start_codon:yes stop_codon:yes gene_type:complete